MFFWFVAALFRLVTRFAPVRIEDSSRNRFASTAYFAKPGTFPGEFSGEGNIPVTKNIDTYQNVIEISHFQAESQFMQRAKCYDEDSQGKQLKTDVFFFSI